MATTRLTTEVISEWQQSMLFKAELSANFEKVHGLNFTVLHVFHVLIIELIFIDRSAQDEMTPMKCLNNCAK